VRLDTALAGGDGVAHEHVEGLVGYHCVLDGLMEEGARLGLSTPLPPDMLASFVSYGIRGR
jgi:hypothetical protein